MKETIRKFEVGDPLTDQECKELRAFFLAMETGCDLLGCEYRLFGNQMRRNRMSVESYLDARGIKW